MTYIREIPFDEEKFPTLKLVKEDYGFIPNFFKVQTARPDLIDAQVQLVDALLLKEGALSRQLKEYVFLVCSAANLSTYCVTAHCEIIRMLKLAGPEPEQIALDHLATDLPIVDKALLNFTLKLNNHHPNGWLDAHGNHLYRYALVRVRDATVAEDLVQETLLAAVAASESHAGRSTERTWLVGILKHKVIDYLRRTARESQFHLRPEGEADESNSFEESGLWPGHWRKVRAPLSWPMQASESREFWQTLEDGLAKLPRQMSIAFALREIDGLSFNEICEILNVTPRYLCVLLHRSRAKLRQWLEAEWFQHYTPSSN